MFHFSKTRKRGFSLPELVVTLGIIAVLAAIVVINGRKADSQVRLSNFAHEVAFLFRTAQSSATNVSVGSTGSGSLRDAPFGISISKEMTAIRYFRDNASPSYKYTSGDTLISSYAIPHDLKISSVCYIDGTAKGCKTPSTGVGAGNSMDFFYKRPNLQLTIDEPTGLNCISDVDRVEIVVSNLDNTLRKYIVLDPSGMIYTSNTALSSSTSC